MFKKTALVASILLVSACSSYDDSKIDYSNDVVVNKTQQQGYVEIVGKDIIPVDLLELNLGLKVSLLSVTANVDDSANNNIDTNATVDTPKSEVFFDIEYDRKKAPEKNSIAEQVSTNKQSEEVFDEYNVVLVNDMKIELNTTGTSQTCNDTICTVSQSFSFPVETSLLEASKVDGLKFSLFETTENEKLILETMIPSRYINALLATD